jgi:hypothetical protein
LATRGFSGLWGRKKEDKDKDLPVAPEMEGDRQDTGLEPSPLIDDAHHEPDGVTEIEGKVEFDMNAESSDHVETTPKQSSMRELPDTTSDEISTETLEDSVSREVPVEAEATGHAR